MWIENNSHLVMIGDSISDAGRGRPVGQELFNNLGPNYIGYLNAMLGAWDPGCNIRISNTGISGHTSRDLVARWQTDVLDLRPDYVSVLIGTNDVWRQFDSPLIREQHVYPDEYRANLEKMVEMTLPHVKGMILMTPFFVEPRRDDPMRAMMDAYGTIVKEVAAQYGLRTVDTQAAMDALTEYMPTARIAWDRVHPNTTGHVALARAFLQAMDFVF